LSRGAASLVAMELARPALDTLKRNISACRENARTLVFACNALSPPPAPLRPVLAGVPRPALRPRPDRAGTERAGQSRLGCPRRADRRGDGRARSSARGQDAVGRGRAALRQGARRVPPHRPKERSGGDMKRTPFR